MSTAVLISGQTRTFAHCFANQQWNLFRKLDDPYFFCSVTDDADVGALEQLTRFYTAKRVFVEHVTQPQLPELPEYQLAQRHSGWKPSVPNQAILRQAWHLARVWDFMKTEYTPENMFRSFVRIRPDLHFHNCALPKFPVMGTVYTPFWGSWGGIPDRFAFIAGHAAAEQYFNYFHKINELIAEGCPFHPETMLGAALERSGVAVRQTLNCEFTTIRTADDIAKGRQHDRAAYTTQDIFRYIEARLEAGAQ